MTDPEETAQQALTRRNARQPWYRKADGIKALIEGYSGEKVLFRRREGSELLQMSREAFERLYNPPSEEAA